jgi:hypothetical protein
MNSPTQSPLRDLSVFPLSLTLMGVQVLIALLYSLMLSQGLWA